MDETMESIRRHIVKVDPEWDPETFDLEVEEEDHTLWEERVEEEELQSQRTGQSDWMNSGVDWWEEETGRNSSDDRSEPAADQVDRMGIARGRFRATRWTTPNGRNVHYRGTKNLPLQLDDL